MLCESAARGRAVRPQCSAKSHVLFFPGSERPFYTTCHLSDCAEFAQEQSQGAASDRQWRSWSGGSKYEPRGLPSVSKDSFTTAVAQPAPWIKPQNLGPADTRSVDAVLQVAWHEPPLAHIHSCCAWLPQCWGAPSLLSSAMGNLPLSHSEAVADQAAGMSTGTPGIFPVQMNSNLPVPSAATTVTSGWHPISASSSFSGGRSLRLDTPCGPMSVPWAPATMWSTWGFWNVSHQILMWVKLTHGATQKDWKRYYSL